MPGYASYPVSIVVYAVYEWRKTATADVGHEDDDEKDERDGGMTTTTAAATPTQIKYVIYI